MSNIVQFPTSNDKEQVGPDLQALARIVLPVFGLALAAGEIFDLSKESFNLREAFVPEGNLLGEILEAA